MRLLLSHSSCLRSRCFGLQSATPAPPAPAAVHGMVADPTGAIVPGAEVDLVEPDGSVVVRITLPAMAASRWFAPHAGNYNTGRFGTRIWNRSYAGSSERRICFSRHVAPAFVAAHRAAYPSLATTVQVNADNSTDLTAPEENRDTSVMTSQDLKSLPIFDNDYATAMSAFLDDSASATGGSGLIVDGVEANRPASPLRPCRKSASTRTPTRRGTTTQAAGRWRSLPSPPPNTITGSSIFYSATRRECAERAGALKAVRTAARLRGTRDRADSRGAEEQLPDFVQSRRGGFGLGGERDVVPTPGNLNGAFQANVAAPTRDTEFSTRAAHQFGEKHSAYVQYSYEIGQGKTRAWADRRWPRPDITTSTAKTTMWPHVDSNLSAVLLNRHRLWWSTIGAAKTIGRSCARERVRRFHFRIGAERLAGNGEQLQVQRQCDLDPWAAPGEVRRGSNRTLAAAASTTTPTRWALTPLGRRWPRMA